MTRNTPIDSAQLDVSVAGETLCLLADKALYWPKQKTLLVADIHIGKAAAYRAQGQPVPHGTTRQNLARLDALLGRHACQRLIFLGDFLHARAAHAPLTLAALHQWREQHAELEIILIRGNHDRHAGDPPASLNMQVVDEPFLLGPWALQHEPTVHPTHWVIAGHVHPVFALRGRGRQRLRMPCFCLQPGLLLLPAFGEFTGGMLVAAESDRRIYGVADGHVWALNS